MAYYTRGEYETDVEWLEQQKAKLRTVFAIGQDRSNNIPRDWRLDGLEYKRLTDQIEGEIEYLGKRLKFAGYRQGLARREKLVAKQAKILDRRSSLPMLREIWNVCDSESAALFRQKGFPVRFTGKWEVRSK